MWLALGCGFGAAGWLGGDSPTLSGRVESIERINLAARRRIGDNSRVVGSLRRGAVNARCSVRAAGTKRIPSGDMSARAFS